MARYAVEENEEKHSVTTGESIHGSLLTNALVVFEKEQRNDTWWQQSAEREDRVGINEVKKKKRSRHTLTLTLTRMRASENLPAGSGAIVWHSCALGSQQGGKWPQCADKCASTTYSRCRQVSPQCGANGLSRAVRKNCGRALQQYQQQHQRQKTR